MDWFLYDIGLRRERVKGCILARSSILDVLSGSKYALGKRLEQILSKI